jgi:ABC-2 type transport system ATP-binding protein
MSEQRSDADQRIQAEGLRKSYGEVTALAGIDLAVPAGTVLALLGPNGAGKTTTVNILTTLVRPDAGRAWVAGYDVIRQAAAVRARIGLAGQLAAVDEFLTGRENLEQIGRLYHLGRREARARADELLETMDLAAAANRTAGTYSGGMRRRLDLAASLVGRPPVLFLDEPTTGLDPQGRIALWEVIQRLVGGGTTVLLTTQYLEEADRLADRIVVMNFGRVIAEGTADDLKSSYGGDRLELRLADPAETPRAAAAVTGLGHGQPVTDERAGLVTLPVEDGAAALPAVVRRLDEAQLRLSGVLLRRPSLDDVFLALTGQTTEAGTARSAVGADA